ncbi:hypothetical protein [Streptomyces sp. SID4920]|nr:hypothetical protein [Streptomyces sp. SID4920]MYS37225.1 hypothetical protein [Streptomyces sp. SID4920]MYX68442.1 hypothetical protein [Streptomyces sp. SID8373]
MKRPTGSRSFSPLQVRALLAVAVLALVLFPNLLTVTVPAVALIGWVLGQPLLAGIAVGGLLFARRGVAS